MKKLSILKNRKLRCGGFSALLTALALVFAVLLGALADTAETRYALTLDCSFNAATTQGETTRAVLAQLERDVHIYALVSETEGKNATLFSLLERYAAASPHVTYSQESAVRNPVLLSQFSDALGENDVTGDCLIVSCPETGRARVLNESNYYVYSYNSDTGYFDQAGYTYEKSVTEAILYVSQDELPVVQILTGHGELSAEDAAVLEETLVNANYLVKRVSLQAGDTLDPESPLMILSPRLDFSDGELDSLMAFAKAGGDFFFGMQYSDSLTLENYNALLRAYGVTPYPGLVIAKEEDADSYYDAPVYLMPYMQETNATLPLISAGKNILLLAGARAFHTDLEHDGNVTLLPVLATGEAYIRNYQDEASLSEQQPGDEEGRFAVALWADKMYEDGTVSHAFVIGNLTLFLDYWTLNNTDSQAFLLQIVRSLQGKFPVSLDILPKNALRAGLSLGNITPAVVVTALLPLLVALGAALVLLPRKNL